MRALEANKNVFCEWPLGANVGEAEAMAKLAAERSLRTVVGLQARSDPALMYARELIEQGYIGEVLAANLNYLSQAQLSGAPVESGRRSPQWRQYADDRRRSCDRRAVLRAGRIRRGPARLATTVPQWHNTDTGEMMPVDSPDWISVSGRLERGAEVSYLVATVPSSPSGNRFEIYGTGGTLVITGGTSNIGPNILQGARGKEPLAAMSRRPDSRWCPTTPRRLTAQRRSGLRPPWRCLSLGRDVSARLCPRRQTPQINRGAGALVGRGQSHPPLAAEHARLRIHVRQADAIAREVGDVVDGRVAKLLARAV